MYSVRFKILLLTLLPVFIVLILIGASAISEKMQFEKGRIIDRIETYVSLLERGIIDLESASHKEEIELILEETVINSQIIDRDYNVLYTSLLNKTLPSRQFIDKAFSGLIIFKFLKLDDSPKLYVAYPIQIGDSISYVLYLEIYFEKSNKAVKDYALFVIILIIAGIIICFALISILLDMTIFKHVRCLKIASDEISKGNLDVNIKAATHDEIGDLCHSFNKMRKEIKKSRHKLQDYSKDLENKVRQRTRRLEKANEELKILDITKDQFISIAAHELKTPLTSIRGFAELMLDPQFKIMKKDVRYYLKLIIKNTESLYNLVIDLIDCSMINVGKLNIEFQNVDVIKIFKDIKNNMEHIIADKGLITKFNIEKDLPNLWADPGRIEQVLRNLIMNAISATDKGQIALNIIRKGKYVQFEVSDTGMGIPKNKQKEIFTRFYQVVPAYKKKRTGSGLGLSISKGLVELMKGKIWFISEEGVGTTFYFTIPVAK